jgi:hypothetical protein
MNSSASEFKEKPPQMSQQEQELEKLAETRANRKANSWSEQFKSPWVIGLVVLAFLGFWCLLVVWASDINLGIKVLVTVMIIGIGWLVYRRHKVWEEKQRRKFYEEELLELRHEKRG